MSKFLIKLVVLGGVCTQGFGTEQHLPSQPKDLVQLVLDNQSILHALEESQNEQKTILDKISQCLDADQSTLDTQLDKISQVLDADQPMEDLSGTEGNNVRLNKSVEIHKLQDETYDQLKENYNLRLEILKKDNQNLKDQLQRQQMPAKNYTMMDRARDGFILLGMAGAAIGGAYLCYKFYEEGGNVFRVKVYY